MKTHRFREAIKHTNPLSVDETVENLIADAIADGPHFSYAPARRVEKVILSGTVTEAEIIRACAHKTNKMSTTCNTEAALKLKEISTSLRDAPVICHPLSKTIIYPYAHDEAVSFKPGYFFTKNGRVHVPWTQYAKNDHYSAYQFALIATILKTSLADEFDDPEILITDLSAPTKRSARQGRFFSASELRLLGEGQVEQFFEVYQAARAIVDSMEIPKPERQKPKTPERDAGLFDL